LKCDQYRYSCCFTSCAIKRKRTTFKPDELATTFVALQRDKRVGGLFLSSGIVPDADTTMEKMLATVECLRLKLIPGASFEYIERAVELADCVSLNLEAPNQVRLTNLAPDMVCAMVFHSPRSGRLPCFQRWPLHCAHQSECPKSRHASQLSLMLGQKGVSVPDWVITARDSAA
jgi:predicted DNA-binding helix-hairpin-helix protein